MLCGLDRLDALLDDVVAVLVGHALDDLALELVHDGHLLLQAQHLHSARCLTGALKPLWAAESAPRTLPPACMPKEPQDPEHRQAVLNT